jgi:hypothetical protein
MLVPHLGYLIIAIVSALASAYLNIEIPQSLGKIVNVVASFVATTGPPRTETSIFDKIHLIPDHLIPRNIQIRTAQKSNTVRI